MRPTETSLTNVLGRQFGPYKLVSRLGVGGMAETFVAIRSGPGGFTQRVCLKLVLPFFRDDESFIRLFEREARLAAKLRHRNIVSVIDFGEIEGTSYMALELVDGVDLRQLLDSLSPKRLAPEFVTLLGLELSEALEHAHRPVETSGAEKEISDEQGIVHRDISPSNILLSGQGEVFLTDFGVAKAISGGSRKQSAVKGKVPYMSPEHLRAEPLDGRADLFSLGVVLFEALAGKRPYEGAHDPATIMRILKGDHEPLATLAPEAPAGLCQVIDSLIDPDREKRPSNGAALLEQLDPFAPSRTSRRRLGRMVVELREATQKATRGRSAGSVESGTEVLSENAPESTGVNRTTEPPPPPLAFTPGSDVPKTDTLEELGSAQEPDSELRGPRSRVSVEANTNESESVQRVVAAQRDLHAPSLEYQDEPIALVRSPTNRGLRADDFLDSVSDRSPKRSPSRRKGVAIALVSLVALGGLTAALVVLWPNSESNGGAAPPGRHTDQLEEPAAPAPVEDRHEEIGAGAPASGDLEETESGELAQPAEPDQPAPELVPENREEGIEVDPPSLKPPTKPPRERPKRAPQTGKVTVTVIPWGDVWIDGQLWGPAPLRGEPLKAGTYRISVGRGKPERTRQVRLKAGERRAVEFDLGE